MIEPAPSHRDLLSRVAAMAGFASGTRRLYLQTLTGVQLPHSRRGRRYWVVSRGLCRFFRVALMADAPRARQAAALDLEIRRLSPFAETGLHIDISGGFAGVWVWDQRVAEAAAGAVGVDMSQLRALPEAALLPPADGGVRLAACLDGFDGQYWTADGLAASRWWPRLPDEAAWALFQRGASVQPAAFRPRVPVPVEQSWLERPWTRTRSAVVFDPARLDLRLAMAGVAVAVIAAYAYEGARYLHLWQQAAAQARDIAARRAVTEPLLAARTQALDNLAATEALRALDRYPGQLALMARIAKVLPASGARLDDWRYDRGQLDLSIASDRPQDVVGLVRALEQSGDFTGVSAERAGNDNTLRLHAGVMSR